MKRYAVCIPITGFIHVEVEAKSKREAIDEAFTLDLSECEIEERHTHEKITEGNVFYGTLNEAYATEVKS